MTKKKIGKSVSQLEMQRNPFMEPDHSDRRRREIINSPTKMAAASLSAYWVKFFKGAGFPLDVATKHAVVFSNNRIKPDMLPDLDKPSLKDMGITLMGDMIAILRYAKKVVEDTTCERFLVDTEDDGPTATKPSVPRVVKKTLIKPQNKVVATSKPKIVQDTTTSKVVKAPIATVAKTVIAKKKTVPGSRVISQVVKEPQRKTVVKRKQIPTEDVSDEDSQEEWNTNIQKRLKINNEEDRVGYTVIMPKLRNIRTQEVPKKVTDQKRTVFDRLGDSSVTSTTNVTEASTTFNITGLGSDVLKRNCSVFNRLGDKDSKKSERTSTGILKNGASGNANVNVTAASPPGILKTRPSAIGSTTIVFKNSPTKLSTKSTGTMHADHEKSQRTTSLGVKQLVKTSNKIRLKNDGLAASPTKTIRTITSSSSRLASERVGSVPAKARLGLAASGATKQVTFDRVTTVAHIKKPGVFSRLGI